jgi:hypothetical protein
MRAKFALLAMAVGVTTAVGFACAEKPPVGLMIAIQTNLSVTKDFDQLGLYITADGVPILTQTYQIEGGSVRLPSTIAIAPPKNPNAVIRVRAVAFKTDAAKVLREGITTVPANRLAVLPLPLKWINSGSGKGTEAEFQVNPFAKNLSICPDLQTKENGVCTASTLNVDQLKDYSAAEIFGGSDTGSGGSCFDVAACFASRIAVPVDETACTVTEPPGMTNIAVATTTGEGEPVGGDTLIVLDEDEYEVTGNTIKLPATLCDPNGLKPSRKAIFLSPSCESKSSKYPICGPYSTGKPLPIVNDAGPLGDAAPDGGGLIEQIGAAEQNIGAIAVGGTYVFGVGTDPNDAGAWRLVGYGLPGTDAGALFATVPTGGTPDFASTALAIGPAGDLGYFNANNVSANLNIFTVANGQLGTDGGTYVGATLTPFAASAKRLYYTLGTPSLDAGGTLLDIASSDKASLSEPLIVLPQMSEIVTSLVFATGPASDGGASTGYLFAAVGGSVMRVEDPENFANPDLAYVAPSLTKAALLSGLSVSPTGKLVIGKLNGSDLSLSVGDAFSPTSLAKLGTLSGTVPAKPFPGPDGNARYRGIATDAKYVYYAHDAGIDYQALDGSGQPTRLVTSPGIYGLATDAKYVYWTQAKVGTENPTSQGFFRRPLVP